MNTWLLGKQLDSRNLLAALGIGSLIISLFVFSVIYTFDNALLTLVSQAYGQRDYQLCAKYLNRQIHLVFMISLPQALLFYFGVDTVLGLLGLNPDIALKAALYVKTCVFGHMFLNISNCY